MRKFLSVLTLALVLAASVIAYAHEKNHSKAGQSVTVQGEVLDSACYFTHEARGKGHEECATKCIQKGIPMALIDSKGELYLLNEDHEKTEPYNQLKNMAAKNVTVTGNLVQKQGWKVLFVQSVK